MKKKKIVSGLMKYSGLPPPSFPPPLPFLFESLHLKNFVWKISLHTRNALEEKM